MIILLIILFCVHFFLLLIQFNIIIKHMKSNPLHQVVLAYCCTVHRKTSVLKLLMTAPACHELQQRFSNVLNGAPLGVTDGNLRPPY